MVSSPRMHAAIEFQGGKIMQGATAANDVENLDKLNAGYMRSVQTSDVRWFEKNLAEDFLNSNPDGSLADREGFLRSCQ